MVTRSRVTASTSTISSIAPRGSSGTAASGSSGPPRPFSPWIHSAVWRSRESGPAAPAATGTSKTPATVSAIRALRLVCTSGTLPPTVVTARRSIPGCPAASQSAKTSSWPGSQSTMTGMLVDGDVGFAWGPLPPRSDSGSASRDATAPGLGGCECSVSHGGQHGDGGEHHPCQVGEEAEPVRPSDSDLRRAALPVGGGSGDEEPHQAGERNSGCDRQRPAERGRHPDPREQRGRGKAGEHTRPAPCAPCPRAWPERGKS